MVLLLLNEMGNSNIVAMPTKGDFHLGSYLESIISNENLTSCCHIQSLVVAGIEPSNPEFVWLAHVRTYYATVYPQSYFVFFFQLNNAYLLFNSTL